MKRNILIIGVTTVSLLLLLLAAILFARYADSYAGVYFARLADLGPKQAGSSRISCSFLRAGPLVATVGEGGTDSYLVRFAPQHSVFWYVIRLDGSGKISALLPLHTGVSSPAGSIVDRLLQTDRTSDAGQQMAAHAGLLSQQLAPLSQRARQAQEGKHD